MPSVQQNNYQQLHRVTSNCIIVTNRFALNSLATTLMWVGLKPLELWVLVPFSVQLFQSTLVDLHGMATIWILGWQHWCQNLAGQCWWLPCWLLLLAWNFPTLASYLSPSRCAKRVIPVRSSAISSSWTSSWSFVFLPWDHLLLCLQPALWWGSLAAFRAHGL